MLYWCYFEYSYCFFYCSLYPLFYSCHTPTHYVVFLTGLKSVVLSLFDTTASVVCPSDAVDREFETRSCLTKDYKIDICCIKKKEQTLVGSESG